MTIGQRIAQKRKERGQSQEALGESLGVSRQSVYKWESDSALPEINKLIAMSRLFGVTVGWLLGVEEPPAPEEQAAHVTEETGAGGELNEAQLKMVEEIVDRYIAAQPAPLKKRRWPWIIGAVAVMAVFWNLFGRLDALNNQYQNLQNSVANVRSDVNNQISSITNRVEEVLKSQNDLTADYATEIVSADLTANTVTIRASATPKTYTEGMEAVFLADTGSGPAEYPGTPGPGNGFTADVTCELTDSITVSVVFITGDVRETQMLYVYSWFYTNSLPAVSVESSRSLLWKELNKAGKLVWNDEYIWVNRHISYSAAAVYDVIGVSEIQSVRVGLFRNRRLVTWLESCEKPDSYNGFEDCDFYRLSDVTIAPEEGDVFALAAVVTDEYGREIVCMDAPFALDEHDKLMYADDAVDIEGWYDGSTWHY